jgi:exodeoxyribonuclease V gamma subunit
VQKKEVIFQSNSLDVLRKELQNRLFSSPFFSHRYVLVSNKKIKQWLLQEFARDPDCQIGGAIKILSLAECSSFFLSFLQKESPTWTSLEVAFFLEKAMEKEIEGFFQKDSKNDRQNSTENIDIDEQQDKDLFSPIIQCLKGQSIKKRKQKIFQLAKETASLFFEYQLLGKSLDDELLDDEPNDPREQEEKKQQESKKTKKDWQLFLWQELTKEGKWPNLVKEFQGNLNEEKIKNVEIHLFFLSHLPKLYHDFLERLSQDLLVCHYQFSPCEVFWEDVVSDREKQALERFWTKKTVKKNIQEELDDYLSDRNSLLANFGVLGREEQKKIEEKESYVFTKYLPVHGKSLLKRVQRDLLTLQNPQQEIFNPEKNAESNEEEQGQQKQQNKKIEEKKERQQEDESIRVYQVASAFRELEVIRDAILSLIKKDKDLSYRDFQVFVPDISKYAAYIPVVFEEKILPYKILDLELKNTSSYIQGIVQLFSLLESTAKKEEVLSLLENPSFQRKQKLSEEDVDTLRKWIEKTSVEEGWERKEKQKENTAETNPQERENQSLFLKNWEWAIERLIADFVFFPPAKEEALPKAFPIHSLGIGDYGLLEKILKIFSQLQTARESIQEEKTLEEWRDIFRKTTELFLEVIEEDSKEQGAKRLFENFLQRLTEAHKKVAEKFSFFSLYQQLKDSLDGIFSYKNYLVDAVSFSSTKSLSVLPSKFIGFLGMNEDLFASETRNPFHLFSSEKEQKTNSVFSQSRYFFLQALCLAEKQIYISYEGISFHEGKEKQPALLIQEFLSYLGNSFITEEGEKIVAMLIKKPPMLPFHQEEFSTPEAAKFSSLNYLAAKAYNQNAKEKKTDGFGRFMTFSFSPEPFKKQENLEVLENQETSCFAESQREAKTQTKKEEKTLEKGEIPKTISLETLRSFARNPIKFYLQNQLQIYIKEEREKTVKLSSFDQQAFCDFFWQETFEKKWEFFEKQGKTPFGLWKEIAKSEILEQKEVQQRHLKKLLLTPEEIFSVELGADVFLDVFVEGQKVSLLGQLKNVSKQGLLVSGEKKLSTMVQIWPEYLCFSSLFPEHEQSMIFYQSGQKKQIKVDQAQEFLVKYLLFFLNTKSQPSPLLREWIEPLFKQKKEAFEKVNNPKLKRFVKQNLYQEWALSYSQPPVYEEAAKWASEVRKVFSPIIEDKSEEKEDV